MPLNNQSAHLTNQNFNKGKNPKQNESTDQNWMDSFKSVETLLATTMHNWSSTRMDLEATLYCPLSLPLAPIARLVDDDWFSHDSLHRKYSAMDYPFNKGIVKSPEQS